MKTVRPNQFKVTLVYICPQCGYDHEAFPEETDFPGGVRCGCGCNIKFETVAKLEVLPTYGKPVETPEKVESEPVTSPLHDDAVAALVSLGFKGKTAEKMVTDHSAMLDRLGIDGFIKGVCCRAT